MNLRRKLLAFLQSQKKTAEYTELEYLESTGTQWIDTGVKGYITCEITAQGSISATTSNVIIGTTGDGGSFFGSYGSTNKWSVGAGTNATSDVSFTEKKTFTIRFLSTETTNFTVDGKTYSRTESTVDTSYNYALFLCMRDKDYPAYAKIYSCKIWNETGLLIRDFIPVLDKDLVPCMYDKITGKYLYNQGDGEFKWKLPNQLEYLESDGEQWLNLDYIPTAETGLHIKVALVGQGDMVICGSRNDTNYTRLFLSSTYSSANVPVPFISIGRGTYLYLQLNGSFVSSTSDLTIPFNTVYEQYTNYKNSKVVRFVDDTRDVTSVEIPELTFTPNQPLYLFAGNIAGVKNYAYKGKIYSCEITEGDKIIMYLIPVFDENLTPCMYDLVSKQYFRNQGTGSFKGYFEDGSLLVSYLSATGTQWIDTGITPLMGDEIELKNVQCNKKGSGYQAVFSAGTGDYQTILLVGDGATYRTAFYKYFATGGAQNVDEPFNLNNLTKIKVDGEGSIYYNDEFVIQSPPVQETDSSLRLFYRANNSSPMTGNIGAVSIKRDGNFVVNLVPVVKSDNTVCMLDLVSKQYFVNQGSGSFSYGTESS